MSSPPRSSQSVGDSLSRPSRSVSQRASQSLGHPVSDPALVEDGSWLVIDYEILKAHLVWPKDINPYCCVGWITSDHVFRRVGKSSVCQKTKDPTWNYKGYQKLNTEGLWFRIEIWTKRGSLRSNSLIAFCQLKIQADVEKKDEICLLKCYGTRGASRKESPGFIIVNYRSRSVDALVKQRQSFLQKVPDVPLSPHSWTAFPVKTNLTDSGLVDWGELHHLKTVVRPLEVAGFPEQVAFIVASYLSFNMSKVMLKGRIQYNVELL